MNKVAILFCCLLPCMVNAQTADTVHVYFATGKSVMTSGVQDQVASYIYKDALRPSQAIQIVGYTDYVGGNTYNDKLSKDRARTVKRFLMNYGFPEKNITVCIGKGKVIRGTTSTDDGFARDRRVDIVVNAPAPVAEPLQLGALPQPVAAPPPVKAAKPTRTAKESAASAAIKNEISHLKKGGLMVLKNLYFFPGSHRIRPESEATLYNLFEVLDENQSIKISIEGHVCCVKGDVGDALDYETREIDLSSNRAKTVYNYLVKKGIDKERLSYRGFGATRRVAEEINETEADKNRRVEIRIL
jgi:outer membrane protein OmpA-like peptidoglycan-associated protein